MLCVSLSAMARVAFAQGAAWTGDMHPELGFSSNPACDINGTLQSCFPGYDTLSGAGKLWPCPDGKPEADSCAASGRGCVEGQGDNPLCMNLSAANPCCCAKKGCAAAPRFNQIIGVCRGEGCACGSSSAPSCGGGRCDASCKGETVRCCFGNDVSDLVQYYDAGSEVTLNYMAAYQFNNETRMWEIQKESSFNTDGSRPSYDLMKGFGGLSKAEAWLAPQPGGAVFWSLGYYPAGVRGVGPPGAMFVLSTEQFWGATWYMLNALTLDRGPGGGYPADKCSVTNDNCWASGNAGEMDFLEPSWSNGDANSTSGYRKSYSTQYNQVGRCFNGAINGGGFGSPNHVLTSGQGANEPFIYVAVVDSVGNWVYRIPADQAGDIWPGIGRKTIAASLPAAPARRPSAVNPCETGFCAVFTSQCQARTWEEADAQQCSFNRQQGFCGNWAADMANTGQPLFPGDDCERDTRGGKQMPWCKEMVSTA